MAGVYFIIPESPYWCANRERHEQGRAIMARLNGGIEGYDVDYHYNIIRLTVEKEKSYQKQIDGNSKGFMQELANLKEVFIGINGFRTLIAFWPAFVQQISGLAVLSSYSSYFARVAGFADPFLFSLLLALVALACTVIEASLIDLIGRRSLFLLGAVSVWVMCMVVGGLGLVADSDRTYAVNQLVVCALPPNSTLTSCTLSDVDLVVLLSCVADGIDPTREPWMGIRGRDRVITTPSQNCRSSSRRRCLPRTGIQHHCPLYVERDRSELGYQNCLPVRRIISSSRRTFILCHPRYLSYVPYPPRSGNTS